MTSNRSTTNETGASRASHRKTARVRCAAIALFGALGVGHVGNAVAGEVYLSGDLGISGGFASSGGSTLYFENSGDDIDSSPIYGFTFGFEAPMNEPLPESLLDAVPDWPVMVELEFAGGRDYEFLTDGADPYRSDVTSWTVMNNLRLDLPLDVPIEMAFGRVPILEPLSFYTKIGFGGVIHDVLTTDNVSRGSELTLGFAWQAGAGFAYQVSRNVEVSMGYRYADLGEVELDLKLGPTEFGNFTLDLTSHEFTSAVRVRFFPLSLRPSGDRALSW